MSNGRSRVAAIQERGAGSPEAPRREPEREGQTYAAVCPWGGLRAQRGEVTLADMGFHAAGVTVDTARLGQEPGRSGAGKGQDSGCTLQIEPPGLPDRQLARMTQWLLRRRGWGNEVLKDLLSL